MLATLKGNTDVVHAFLALGVDPAYPTRFVDDVTGKVLESREALLSELTLLAQFPPGVEVLHTLLTRFTFIGGKHVSSYYINRKLPMEAFMSGEDWMIEIRVRRDHAEL